MSSKAKVLVLGGRPTHDVRLGWHLNELNHAAARHNVTLYFADYESLRSRITNETINTVVSREPTPAVDPDTGRRAMSRFDAVLTRTMPAGSLEQITFRLATLHDEYERRRATDSASSLVNPPRGLELAIDKYATLAMAARLGIPTPPTCVVQSRAEAIEAFSNLGGDVVVKPIFGGEGRGVMRIQDPELAWTVFSTLEQIDAMMYVQKFLPPGGVDVRLLVIGENIHAVRRTSQDDFRTNSKAGGKPESITLCDSWATTARTLCDAMKLRFAAVDLIETNDGQDHFLVEVNAIPGWKSAQSALPRNLADDVLSLLLQSICRS